MPKKKPPRRNKNGSLDGRISNDPTEINKPTRFKPGHTPYNKGLRKMLEEYGYSRAVINERFAQLLSSNQKQLTEIERSEETTMLELISISILNAARRNSDTGRLDNMLDKAFGREPIETKTTNLNINAEAALKKDADAEIVVNTFKMLAEMEKKK